MATGDRDLEAVALARRGYAELAAGGVASGTDRLDEAMAAATGGDVRSLDVVGDITCVAIAAFELSSDWQRIEQWGQVMESWIQNHDDVAVLGFCYACCSELFLASGSGTRPKGMLTEGLAALQAAGHRSRCVHPAAKLAELRFTQGRLEEAEQLLAGFEELPEAAHGIAHLHLVRGEGALAAATIHRRLNRIGDDNVLAAPFLAMLVEVQLSQGDVDGAAGVGGSPGPDRRRIGDRSRDRDGATSRGGVSRPRAGVPTRSEPSRPRSRGSPRRGCRSTRRAPGSSSHAPWRWNSRRSPSPRRARPSPSSSAWERLAMPMRPRSCSDATAFADGRAQRTRVS